MALAFHVAGCVDATYDGNNLGIATDGFQVAVDPRWEDIMTDCYGGPRGIWEERQFLGATGRVSCELVKFEKANVFPLLTFQSLASGGSIGVIPDIGDFVIADGLAQDLVLAGRLRTWTFSLAHVAQAVQIGVNGRAQKVRLSWDCRISSSTLKVLFTEAATV